MPNSLSCGNFGGVPLGYSYLVICEFDSQGIHLGILPRLKSRQRLESPIDKIAAFQLIKQKLCSAPILALPEGSEDFIAYCDASIKGLGAVLMQREKCDLLMHHDN
ncbi:putative reverse transcriptase domain-containing protein [Tanacetum coccineum]